MKEGIFAGHAIELNESSFGYVYLNFSSIVPERGNVRVSAEYYRAAQVSFKMGPELKAAWVKELREGDQTQTQGALKITKGSSDHKVGRCCLGVYCEVRRVPEREGEIGIVIFGTGVENSTSYLPAEIEAELPRRYQVILATLNDDNWTFPEIAQVIEACF